MNKPYRQLFIITSYNLVPLKITEEQEVKAVLTLILRGDHEET